MSNVDQETLRAYARTRAEHARVSTLLVDALQRHHEAQQSTGVVLGGQLVEILGLIETLKTKTYSCIHALGAS
jgi:hypothetical protein